MEWQIEDSEKKKKRANITLFFVNLDFKKILFYCFILLAYIFFTSI